MTNGRKARWKFRKSDVDIRIESSWGNETGIAQCLYESFAEIVHKLASLRQRHVRIVLIALFLLEG
jgi:hypothetical protein